MGEFMNTYSPLSLSAKMKMDQKLNRPFSSEAMPNIKLGVSGTLSNAH